MQYLTYIAIVLFLGGSLYRIFRYIQSPNRFPILLMPAPRTRIMVVLNVLLDILILRRLFLSNKLLWIGSWIFHWGWLYLVFSHLRFFWKPSPPLWILNLQIYEKEISFLWMLSIGYLLTIRIVSSKTRYISTVEDYAVLLLFFGIALTGLFLKYRDPVSILLVQDFIQSLWNFSFREPFPDHHVFRLHFIFNLILLSYFPFGKLTHSFGLFFSPTLYSVDKGG